MLKTVLFDLDGTLLPIDTDQFVHEYMRELATSLAPYIPPRELPGLIWASTLAMMANTDPDVRNYDAFFNDFWPRVQHPPEVLLPAFDSFYQEQFPRLQRCAPVPSRIGRSAVEQALERGYEIVLATNPLFPAVAIRERMRWAGIVDLPWRFVTVLENMHHCKPQAGYYVELLTHIRREPSECLMVGNDVEEDGAAAGVGMPVYLVTDYLINRRGLPIHAEKGPLQTLPDYLAAVK